MLEPQTDRVNFDQILNVSVVAVKEGSTLTGDVECVWLAPVARWPKSRVLVAVVVEERPLLQGCNRTKARPTTSSRQSGLHSLYSISD